MDKQRKIRFSTRFRLLFIFIGLLLSSITLFLYFSLDLFTKDKTAYIYESSLFKSESLSESFINFSENILKDSTYWASTSASSMSDNQNNSPSHRNKNIIAIFLIRSTNDDNIAIAFKSINETLINELNIKYGADLSTLEEKILGHMSVSLKNSSPEPISAYNLTTLTQMPAVAYLIRNQEENFSIISIASIEKLTERFENDPVYNNFLLDSKGQVFIGKNTTKTVDETNIQNIINSPISKGTIHIQKDAEGHLVSYCKENFLNLITITEISEKKAFAARDHLILRSTYFGVFIVGIAVILVILLSTSITNPIKELMQGTQEVAMGNFTKKIEVKTNDELGALADSFNFMSSEIERLIDETAEKARMAQELETAKTVQSTLFPKLSCKINHVDIAGYYQAASECNGDWWYYTIINEKIFFLIGDATGHGVPAALVTAAVRSTLSIIELMKNVSPQKVLTYLNKAIYQTSKGNMCMTFFVASYDLKTRRLTYSNASHTTPFLLDLRKEDLSTDDLEPLSNANAPRLGENQKQRYSEHSIILPHNSFIIFYTDGITELENEKERQLGEKKFLKMVVESIGQGKELPTKINFIVNKVHDYRGSKALQDDITFFTARFN